RQLDTLAIRAPQVGKLIRSLATARLARLMGTLLESKVPMLECLALTREASTNGHYVRLLDRAEESLTRGEPFSTAIAGVASKSGAAPDFDGTRGGLISP